ncbi:hypothetical protein [Thermococcus piezophilus]|uniref:hypothetical protein n=1 Tax=Thermococcus piezophilus TaxID=1712654 RepID=UPI00190178E4|nr:hypothetical protein [Thermococcus piezophilus]
MNEARLAFLFILTVLASGCLKGRNFVYVKGKTLARGHQKVRLLWLPESEHESILQPQLRLVSENGRFLKDFGTRTTSIPLWNSSGESGSW